MIISTREFALPKGGMSLPSLNRDPQETLKTEGERKVIDGLKNEQSSMAGDVKTKSFGIF